MHWLNTYRILFIAMAFCGTAYGQSIELDRQLIGAGHTEFSNETNFTLSASVGEAIVATEQSTNLIITQGFQQSNYVLSEPFIADLTGMPAACLGANDGSATVDFISAELKRPLSYQWSTGDTTKTIVGLVTGIYDVTVTGSKGRSVRNTVRIGAVDSIDCLPAFYNGITPNGDNFNDYWHIDNAAFFATKNVEIFNRYGVKVWESNNYDNVSGPFTGAHQNGNNLPDGTYFYIAKFDDSTYRGWIEITR